MPESTSMPAVSERPARFSSAYRQVSMSAPKIMAPALPPNTGPPAFRYSVSFKRAPLSFNSCSSLQVLPPPMKIPPNWDKSSPASSSPERAMKISMPSRESSPVILYTPIFCCYNKISRETAYKGKGEKRFVERKLYQNTSLTGSKM